jgi:hypothetical protein
MYVGKGTAREWDGRERKGTNVGKGTGMETHVTNDLFHLHINVKHLYFMSHAVGIKLVVPRIFELRYFRTAQAEMSVS